MLSMEKCLSWPNPDSVVLCGSAKSCRSDEGASRRGSMENGGDVGNMSMVSLKCKRMLLVSYTQCIINMIILEAG